MGVVHGWSIHRIPSHLLASWLVSVIWGRWFSILGSWRSCVSIIRCFFLSGLFWTWFLWRWLSPCTWVLSPPRTTVLIHGWITGWVLVPPGSWFNVWWRTYGTASTVFLGLLRLASTSLRTHRLRTSHKRILNSKSKVHHKYNDNNNKKRQTKIGV